MKKILAVILAFALLFCATPVFAMETTAISPGEIVSPQFEVIQLASANISIVGGEAKCSAKGASRLSGYTVKVEMKLQKQSGQSWTSVATWTGTGTGTLGVSLNESKDGLDSGTYRTSAVVRIYDSNNAFIESTTVNSNTVTYKK